MYFAAIYIQLSNEVKEALGLTDRKCNAMGGELEESKALLDAAVRGQRQVEQELSDTREQGSDMQGTCDTNIKHNIDNKARKFLHFHVIMNQLALLLLISAANAALANQKRKMEGDIHQMQADLDNMLGQSKGAEEKAKKAMVDAGRLSDELRAEQDHTNAQDKVSVQISCTSIF